MSRARFAFAAHPDAIADLRQLPDKIRDLALLELQNLVHGSGDCLPLTGRLAGYHKVYVDPAVSYRMVIQFRPALPAAAHKREIYLVAAGAREDYAVYRKAQLRTNRPADTDATAEARVQAARSRSPPHVGPDPVRPGHRTGGSQPHRARRLPKGLHAMTAVRTPLACTELAGLLTDAARSVSEVLTTKYPTSASRSYPHPVLGALSAGPRVVCELNNRLAEFVVEEPLPSTPAGLFTLASYASALGWLTESLAGADRLRGPDLHARRHPRRAAGPGLRRALANGPQRRVRLRVQHAGAGRHPRSR